jgi:hypothetical protein
MARGPELRTIFKGVKPYTTSHGMNCNPVKTAISETKALAISALPVAVSARKTVFCATPPYYAIVINNPRKNRPLYGHGREVVWRNTPPRVKTPAPWQAKRGL